MRIQAANTTAPAKTSAGARRASSGSFSIGDSETARTSTPASSLRAVSTVDALLTLQGIDDLTERRKRAVAKGRNALDVLDRLKLSLLDGNVEPSTLARLKVAADGLQDPSGDPGLDSILSEIDLRVAVELAKAGVA
jgi:hypothetical protein